MCNKEQLVGYLYDELPAAERTTVEAHLVVCVECWQEVGGLRQTRQHLSTWAPPQPEFNFHIVRGASAPPPARRFVTSVPRWALATAASVLLLAGAAALANVEMQYGPQGFVVRTGWANGSPAPAVADAAAPAAAVPAQAVPVAASSEQLMADVAALARRLHELEQAQTTQLARLAGTARPGVTVPELRRILADTDARQRTEMAMQVAQIWKDFNAARASDLARVQDVVGRAQGLTNQQLRQHRDSIESLYRVSAAQQR